jgi:hypothetical protein
MAGVGAFSLTIATPYENADQAVLDNVCFQVWYRQLGTVSIHFGIARTVTAAQWLAANGRGGSISWTIPGRLALWSGVIVAPGVPGSPTTDIWIGGGAILQRNTVLVKKGWWELNLQPGST